MGLKFGWLGCTASVVILAVLVRSLPDAGPKDPLLLSRDGRGLHFESIGARTHLKGFHSLGGSFPDASHQIRDQLEHLKHLTESNAAHNASVLQPGHLGHEEEEEVKAPQTIARDGHGVAGEGLLGLAAHSLSYSVDGSMDSYQNRERGATRRTWSGPRDEEDPGKREPLLVPTRTHGGRVPPSPPVPTGMVFLLTMLMAGCSGLGALPYFFTGTLSKEWSGLANAVACGVMLAASFDLVHEGEPHGAALVILGIVLGGAFISATQLWLEQFEHVKFEGLQGAGARKTLLMVCIMAAHALGEGSGVGVSFCGQRGWAQGVLVTLAIGLHNIPEGLAVATVLVAKGVSVRQAVLWTLLTALPQPLVAVPAYMFVDSFRSLLPVALGFAAGCMVWMVFAELLPDALADAQHRQVATAATLSAAWLEMLRMMLAKLEQPDGSLAPPVSVDLREVAPTCLLLLLPAVAASVSSGGMMLLWAPTGPLALGAAAGVLIWIGGAETVLQLLNPHAHVLATALAVVCGGGVVVLIWRAYAGTPIHAGKKRDQSSGDVEAQMKPLPLASGPPSSGADYSSGGESWEKINVQRCESEDGARPMYAGTRALPRRPVAASALPNPPPSQESGNALPLSSAALYSQRSMPAASSPRTFASYHTSGLGAFRQTQVAGLGLLVLAAQGVPEGWLMGSLAEGGPDVAGRLLLPACLRALLKGAVAVCLARPLLSQSILQRVGVAAAVGSIAPLVAIACVLAINPLAQPAIALHQGLTLAWRGVAVMAGAALTAGLWKLYPTARALHKRSAQRGLALGLLAGPAVYLCLGALCAVTPFCLATSLR